MIISWLEFVLSGRQNQLAGRMEFEQLKFRLMAFIVITEMKLKSWTVKLGRQPEVEQMLEDYNVSVSSLCRLSFKLIALKNLN